MKPLKTLDSARITDAVELRLLERDGDYYLEQDGIVLADTRATLPVRHMLELACRPFKAARKPIVLIDGLRLGTALAVAQKELPQKGSSFVLAEPLKMLPAWHRCHLNELHAGLLDDERIDHQTSEAAEIAKNFKAGLSLVVVECIGQPRKPAVPCSLLGTRGLSIVHSALKVGGLLVVSASSPDRGFRRQLEKNGFQVAEEYSPLSEKSKSKRLAPIWIARKGVYQSQNQRQH